ncbi:unnamed protein product [Diatraea saccharalis]|uniref:Uncharacterized protein n=1 Tax=Diatraea saccharalis TaxID=40085 RepID=A0A9N9R9I8_9NEOP|nr:unnamed protein product [Diatraea saccharalis]
MRLIKLLPKQPSWIQDLRKLVLASKEDELIMLETSDSQVRLQVPNTSPQPSASHLVTLSNLSSDSQQITSKVTSENLWKHRDEKVMEFSSMEYPSTSAIVKVKQ